LTGLKGKMKISENTIFIILSVAKNLVFRDSSVASGSLRLIFDSWGSILRFFLT